MIAATIVPPTAVEQELIPGWIEPDERKPYAQITWSSVFDVEEVAPV